MIDALNNIGFGGDFVDKGTKNEQIYLIQKAIESGVNVFDTAEIYSAGRSESVLGESIRGFRSEVFLSTKFSPNNANFYSIIDSCERSLSRLNTDYIDLYQIHWPYPNSNLEIVKAFKHLKNQGKILNFGVCNYSKKEMLEINELLGDDKIYSNQVEYNLYDRYIENDILPYCNEQQIRILAYSPLNKCRKILDNDLIKKLSTKYKKTPAQIALNWLTKNKNTIALPKTNNLNNLILNIESNKFFMEDDDYKQLNSLDYNVKFIDPKKIIVSKNGEGNRKVYTTLTEALNNHLNFSPSPAQLSEMIDDNIKPVRLMYNKSGDKYYLVEGRIRYWAWVIRNGFIKKIPSLIY
jgi:diketogulonate reductase-like aldo/keto reductase